MTTRARDLLTGLAAVTAIAAVLVGVPSVLTAVVGNPLPHTLPTGTTIAETIRGDQPIADTVWINTIALLIWLTWIRLTAGLVLEVVSRAQRQPRSLRLDATHVQRGIGAMVASVALILTALHMQSAVTTPLPRLTPPPAYPPPPSLPPPPPERPHPPTTAATWTVQRRDSLWRIAEQPLGDGRRYREIFDLNRDRPQADGGV